MPAGSQAASTGAPGASSAPVSPRPRVHAQAIANGAASAPIHSSQRSTGSRRRRARKYPSSAASRAGSSRQPTSRRTDQSGSTLRTVTMPCGSPANAGPSIVGSPAPAASIAVTARTAARPSSAIRASDTEARGAGPRSPEADSRTAGRPSAAGSPWPETVNGSARRAHWPLAWLPPGFGLELTSRRAADSSVRTRPIGGCAAPLDHGTTNGLRTRREAMSPSTITASIGAPALRCAHRRAPALPPVPPEVETSTSVLRSSRTWKTRASSISAAVPESSGSPGTCRESRLASTTMRRLERPGRTPVTVER